MNMDMDVDMNVDITGPTNDITTPFYLLNPVFVFFLIFSTVSLFYHCTAKTDLSLFEEFLRISQEHNFHKHLVSSGEAIGTMFMALTNSLHPKTNDAETNEVTNREVTTRETTVIKFEDKFLDWFLELKPQTALTPEFLESLANNFVMECTPNGNIIMFYDHKRETFAYYADNAMPFRFLEVLGRKYVCTFQCPSLYHYSPPAPGPAPASAPAPALDTVELVSKEEPVVKEDPITKDATEEHNADNVSNAIAKKSVFAKFKSYNKETSNKVVTKDAPSSAPTTATNANATVSEPSNTVRNRYTCHGKICNMPFLKKIDRTIVDKNYKMSFSDFKRLKTTH